MRITFYGVRGSLPSPGPDTAAFGGNTSCVHVRLACGTHLIFDAGTGIRRLGRALAQLDDPLHVLLTHSHWDHIQGFPFFQPIHQREREIHICRSLPDGDARFNGVLEQMNGHNFPVPWDSLPSQTAYMPDPGNFFERHDFAFTRKTLNHPGGGYAYRIDADGASLAFVTDNELEPPDPPATTYGEWVEFCHGVDILVHDAQYTEEDMPHKHGWGHSLVSQVRRLAHDAEVGCLVLYHHDPERSDMALGALLDESDAWFRTMGSRSRCVGAFEGMTIDVCRDARGDAVLDISATRPERLGGSPDPAD